MTHQSRDVIGFSAPVVSFNPLLVLICLLNAHIHTHLLSPYIFLLVQLIEMFLCTVRLMLIRVKEQDSLPRSDSCLLLSAHVSVRTTTSHDQTVSETSGSVSVWPSSCTFIFKLLSTVRRKHNTQTFFFDNTSLTHSTATWLAFILNHYSSAGKKAHFYLTK